MVGKPGFYTGLVIGGVIGVGAAMLFAPKSGREVREQLFADTGEWRARMEEASALARDAANTIMETGKEVIEQQKLRLQEAIQEGREAAAETTAEMLAKYEKARHGEEDSA